MLDVCGIQPEHCGDQLSPMVVLVKMAQDSMPWSNAASFGVRVGEERELNLSPVHLNVAGVSGQIEMKHHELRLS